MLEPGLYTIMHTQATTNEIFQAQTSRMGIEIASKCSPLVFTIFVHKNSLNYFKKSVMLMYLTVKKKDFNYTFATLSGLN